MECDHGRRTGGRYTPTGIWADGVTLWGAGDLAGAIYACAVPGLCP